MQSFTIQEIIISHNDSKLKDLPTVLQTEVIKFLYYICNKCKKCSLQDYKCNCNKTYCQFHFFLNISEYSFRTCNNQHSSRHKMLIYPEYVYTTQLLKCDINMCYYVTQFVTLNNTFYCMTHIENIVCILFGTCSKTGCNNYTAIINKYTYMPKCNVHIKNENNYMLNYYDLRKEIPKTEIIGKCNDCEKQCSILYTCSCGVQRCNNCSFIFLRYNKSKVLICEKCTSSSDYRIIKKTFIKSTCYICNDSISYICDRKYYCSNHISYTVFTRIYECSKHCCTFYARNYYSYCNYHLKKIETMNT